mmetsp:Transcript_21598/g.74148  ORF Transcript_21598/g.74148 Transcript_21598/m.74148 type:complete len:343 (+) Transcript_21598:3-1031(+)
MRRLRATEREVVVLKRVADQPRCVFLMDAFMEGFFSYIVMERCEMSLLQGLESFADYTEFTLKQVLSEMLRALSGIHAMGVVHRDVKPDNFLCSGRGDDMVVKLCDFGLADIISESKPELKDVYGTAPFMSPEMLSGKGYGTHTDMWSFGVLAYVMLLGQFPYHSLDRTSKGMKSSILSGIPEPSFRPKVQITRFSNSGISPGATCFLQRVMCREPEARPSADRALNIAWLRMMASPEERSCALSLKPMFDSAKHAGAFTVAASNNGDEVCNVEAELNALQAEYHKKESFLVTAKRSDTESTEADSGSAVESPDETPLEDRLHSPSVTVWVTPDYCGQAVWA